MSELPITATVAQFRKISGLGKTSIYHLLKVGDLQSRVICGRRLILLSSWIELLNRPPKTAKVRRRSRFNDGSDDGYKMAGHEKSVETQGKVAEGMSVERRFATVRCRSESMGKPRRTVRAWPPMFADVRVGRWV